MSTMKYQRTVYYGPSTTGTTYPSVGTVFAGSTVDILWKEGNYAYIKYDISGGQCKCGYVLYSDINVSSTPPNFTPNMVTRYVKTAGSTYRGPSDSGLYPVAGSVPLGEAVEYTGKKSTDYKLAFIEYNLTGGGKKRAWFPAMQLSYSPPSLVVGDRPNDMNLNSGASYHSNVNMYYRADLVGQCTWFCWGRAHEKCNRSIVFNEDGNHGSQWYANAIGGYSRKAPASEDPMKNAVASFSDSTIFGHVVFIEDVVDGNVYYTEANKPLNNKLDENDGKVKVISKSQFKSLYGKTLEGYLVL